MVDIAFLRDGTVIFVARRAKSVAVHSSCINPGSELPSCICLSGLGLVYLQDSHGMQDRGCLACTTISFGRERSVSLQALDGRQGTIPPSGGVSQAQVHRDRSLRLGNAR